MISPNVFYIENLISYNRIISIFFSRFLPSLMRRKEPLKLMTNQEIHTPKVLDVSWIIKNNGMSTLVRTDDDGTVLDAIDELRNMKYPIPILKSTNTEGEQLDNLLNANMLRLEDSFAEEVFATALGKICPHKPKADIPIDIIKEPLSCSCGMTSNLWLCLSCGFISCGRITSFELCGGNGHMLKHNLANPEHCHAVRIGTITAVGSDIHCYSCCSSVQSRHTNFLLQRLGINRRIQKKTSPNWLDLTRNTVSIVQKNRQQFIHGGNVLPFIFTLPEEIIIHCLSFIGPAQAMMLSFGSTTRFSRALCLRAVERNLFGINLVSARSGWQFFLEIEAPNLTYIKWTGVTISKKHCFALSQFTKLHTLILNNSNYEDVEDIFVTLAKHCTSLKVLSVDGSSVALSNAVNAFEQSKLTFKSITALDLVDERYTSESESVGRLLHLLPSLEAIRLSCHLTEELARKISEVKKLTILEFTGIPPGYYTLPSQLLSCSKLTHLLVRPYRVCKQFLEEIPTRLPSLQVVDLLSTYYSVGDLSGLHAAMPSLLFCVSSTFEVGIHSSNVLSPVAVQNYWNSTFSSHPQCLSRVIPDHPTIKRA